MCLEYAKWNITITTLQPGLWKKNPSTPYGCMYSSRSQWSSGSTLACGAKGPRIEPHCGQKFAFFTKITAICSLTAVPRLTQPSTLRGTVNEYQPHFWVKIQMAMDECLAYSSLQVDYKVKFAAWPMNWRPPGTDWLSPEDPKWSLACEWRRRW